MTSTNITLDQAEKLEQEAIALCNALANRVKIHADQFFAQDDPAAEMPAHLERLIKVREKAQARYERRFDIRRHVELGLDLILF